MRLLTQLLLSLLTLATIAWAGWQSYLLLSNEQNKLEPGTQSLLVIVAVLVIVGIYMLNTGLRKASLNIAHGAAKVAVYEQFIKDWLTADIDPKTTARMALLAAQPVLKAVNKLMAVSKAEGRSSAKTQAAFEALLVAMRADLGNPGFYYPNNELSKLFQPETI